MFKIRRRRQLIMSQNYSNFLECMTALKWKTIFLNLLNIFPWIVDHNKSKFTVAISITFRWTSDRTYYYVLYVMEFVMLFLFQRWLNLWNISVVEEIFSILLEHVQFFFCDNWTDFPCLSKRNIAFFCGKGGTIEIQIVGHVRGITVFIRSYICHPFFMIVWLRWKFLATIFPLKIVLIYSRYWTMNGISIGTSQIHKNVLIIVSQSMI